MSRRNNRKPAVMLSTVQHQLVGLKALRAKPRTTHALLELGVHHPAGRLRELRQAGHLIETTLVVSYDGAGYPHPRVARYVLIQPQQAGAYRGQAANDPSGGCK